MAIFTGINDSSTFNPGFAFSDWSTSIQTAENGLGTLISTLESAPTSSGQYSDDGSYYANWADGTNLWFKASFNPSTGIGAVKSFDLTAASGTDIGFIGNATFNTNNGAIGNITAKEIWIDSANGYGVDYRGSLSFNIDTGTATGNLKTMYLLSDNGGQPGDANYVKLGGSVTLDANGDFTGGKFTSLEWGTVTFSGNQDPTFSITTTITGLQIDATTAQTAINTGNGSFDNLMSLAYSGNDTVTGTSGDDHINAGAGNDKIFGGDGNDYLVGGNGNDIINGGAGDDHIWGDTNDPAVNATFTASNDTITDLQGNNFVFAGSGNNVVTVGDGNDWVQAGNGNDKIIVGGGDSGSTMFSLAADQSVVNPGSGPNTEGYTDDYFSSYAFNNVVRAGLGNNTITAGNSNDYIKTDDDYQASGNGVDTPFAYTKATDSGTIDGNNKIIAGDGYNVILVGDGNNSITAGNGPTGTDKFMNQVWAGNGNNKIITGSGDDLVVAGNGNNNVAVGDGANQIHLGNGNNTVSSGAGNDIIGLGIGNNKVMAGDGDNQILAGSEDAFNTYLNSAGVTKGNGMLNVTTGAGNDIVSAWEGNDIAKVGAGADQVNLGAGKNMVDLGADSAADHVTFGWDFFAAALDHNATTLAFNTVNNFNANDLLDFDFQNLGALTLDQIDVSAHASLTTGNHNLVLDTSTGKLYYDADGTGNGEAAIQIGLIKGTGLTGAYATVDGTNATIHSGLVV